VNEAAKISGYSASRNRRLSASEYFCCFLTPFVTSYWVAITTHGTLPSFQTKCWFLLAILPVVVALDYSSIRLG
jgi:hypothetical protein